MRFQRRAKRQRNARPGASKMPLSSRGAPFAPFGRASSSTSRSVSAYLRRSSAHTSPDIVAGRDSAPHSFLGTRIADIVAEQRRCRDDARDIDSRASMKDERRRYRSAP